MASFRRRNSKWQVQIRRKNFPLLTQTFQSKQLARRWVRKQEAKLDEGYYLVNNKYCSLKKLICRYIEEVLPKKRVGINETIILKAFMRQSFINKLLIQITAEDFAQYRDKRLESVKPATLLRELCVVQHLYNIANKE